MKRLSLLIIYLALTMCGFAENHGDAERLDEIRAKEMMYTADAVDDAFLWKIEDVNSNKTAMTVGDRGDGGVGPNSATIGQNNVAANLNSYAGGQNAIATNDTSFVWNGETGTNTFGSHGNGTFSINPVRGLTGIYVGNTTLYEQISEMVQPTPAEEDFIMYYNTSFDEWPHTLNIVDHKNQFYELKEGSTYPVEPLLLRVPTTTPLKYVKLTIYIHQSPMRMFFYDIAPDNIDAFPINKIWLDNDSDKDAIWKFELESFPGCENWTLMRYTQHETKAPYVWMTDRNGTITNVTPAVGGNIFIPSSVNGEAITALDNNLFLENSNLRYVKIAEGITTLGSSTFTTCSNLEGISLPATLETIGFRTFSECSSLESIQIPDSVSTIGAFAFFNCGIRNVDFSSKTKEEIQSITDYYWGLSNCSIQCKEDEIIEIE